MGWFEDRKLKKQREQEAKRAEEQAKRTGGAFGNTPGTGIGAKPSAKQTQWNMEDEQERKKLIGILISKMNKFYGEADLLNNATLRNQCQTVIDRLQRTNLVTSPALSNSIAQFLDKYITDAISSLQAPGGQLAAYQSLLAINAVIGDMTSNEKARFYTDDRYLENKVKLIAQEALVASYRRDIAAINAQANTLAADAKTIGMTPSMLNEELKKLAASKKKLEEHIQQCQILINSFQIILNQVEDNFNVNSVGGTAGVTVDVSTAVEERTALQDELSGIVDINEQGNANNINVGNSNLGMSSTVTAPNNNEALEGENEALLAGFNS